MNWRFKVMGKFFQRGHTVKNKKERGKEEEYYITNKNQHPYQNLLMENSPVNSDLEAVLAKAAKRLANKIIYNVKD